MEEHVSELKGKLDPNEEAVRFSKGSKSYIPAECQPVVNFAIARLSRDIPFWICLIEQPMLVQTLAGL